MKRAGAILLFIFLLFPGGLWAEEKLDLRACYELALRRSETVAISAEEINLAKARYTQALGTVLPKISIKASEFLQDDSANTSTATTTGAVTNTFTRFSRPEVGVNVTQNLFQGLKEVTAMKLAGVDQIRARFVKEDVERLLYQDVATVFYTIAQIELNIQTTQKIIQVVHAQIKDLKARVALGKSRESELAAQEADLSLLEAGLEEQKGLRQVAYQMMSFLTGLDPHPPIFFKDPTAGPLPPVEDYTARAEGRPDVMAARKEEEIAKGEVKIRKGDLLPQATAEFNAYAYRVGFQKDIHWDATFNMEIPLFNWSTFGFIREAKIKAKQSQLKSERTQRLAANDIKKAYEAYVSSRRQLNKYRLAARKAEESFRMQWEDFKTNLITSLDVLQSQRTWLLALRQLNDAKVRAWTDWVTLQITAGIKP